jgi:protocatechuate 3,4-dioxygenase beta subunit
MTGATARKLLAVAWLLALITGCQAGDSEPAADRATTSAASGNPPTASSPAGGATCPSPASSPAATSGAVDPDSVLVPGPSNGLPKSDAPAERLVIVATVLGPDCQPAAGATVNVWHTDSRGKYGNEEIECCYYWGTVSTDRAGHFELDSIRPGQYRQPDAPPAHIHLEITHAAGRLMTEIVFADDPDVPPGIEREGAVPVALRESGSGAAKTWRGEVTFVVGRQ